MLIKVKMRGKKPPIGTDLFKNESEYKFKIIETSRRGMVLEPSEKTIDILSETMKIKDLKKLKLEIQKFMQELIDEWIDKRIKNLYLSFENAWSYLTEHEKASYKLFTSRR